MQVPDELRYTNEHEWVRNEDGLVRVGITDYAQDALGDVVFVDLPEVGAQLEASAVIGEIESTKSVSDIYSPVAGTVVEVNDRLTDEPQLCNASPYGDGWMLVIEPADPEAVAGLLSAADYTELTGA